MTAYPRGFKARCENIALSIRQELERRPHDPISVVDLADYLGVLLITPQAIRGMSERALRVSLKEEKGDWSGMTLSIGGNTVVIYNPTSSPGRRSSDIAHELAHIILRHEPSTLMFAPDGTWALRSHNGRQEAEAAWLSGCLLLPRPAVLRVAEMGLRPTEAAALYVVSEQMLGYRTEVTGVTRQLARRRGGGSGQRN